MASIDTDSVPAAGPDGVVVIGDVSGPAYADGSEGRLASVLDEVEDLDDGSPELEASIQDWPTLYHLSPYRSTILDCLGFDWAALRVLELGAGCGAVTRWLGQRAAAVDAVEGSLARARIARQRARGLDNVQIYAADAVSFAPEPPYDVVTLIGVLEYAAGDPTGPSGASRLLEQARSTLAPGGVLVLAIENALGLKYWSGAPEDHTTRPFDSLLGYPQGTHARTFSRARLERLLRDAGFDRTDLLLPFPDYKLATTILRADADHAAVRAAELVRAPFPHEGSPRQALFPEALALDQIVDAGLLADLANSFVIVAHAPGDGGPQIEPGWAARHYALGRRREFAVRATISAGDTPAVRRERIYASDRGPRSSGDFVHQLVDEPLAVGRILERVLLADMQRMDCTTLLASYLEQFEAWLRARFGPEDELAPAAVDAVFANIVVDEDGTWQPIDLEWERLPSVPIDWVVWRALANFGGRYALTLPWLVVPDAYGFADTWTRALMPHVTEGRLGAIAADELAFQEAARGSLNVAGRAKVLAARAISTERARAAVLEELVGAGAEERHRRLQAQNDVLVAEAEHARAAAAEAERALAEERQRADGATAERDAMASTRVWRTASRAWSVRDRLRGRI